jgi:predicted negative regulator of RcsB-dependent stress response
MQNIKQYGLGLLIGVILTIVSWLGYVFYQGIKIQNQNQATLTQVVDFINAQIKASQPEAKK